MASITDAAASLAADAVVGRLDGGYLRVYSGSRPADADTALSGQVLLAELRFADPAFAAAVGGVAVAHPVAPDSDADATGTAAWFRTFEADGSTAVVQGSVGTSGAEAIIGTTAVVQHAVVSCLSFTYIQATG